MTVKENILVVDDDLNSLQVVEQFLKLKKYEVTPCLTFGDAKREFSPGLFDAAILDYYMPDTTGLDMMRQLRETDPDLPVIILTGERDIKIAVEAMKQGAFNYILKPVDPDELYSALENAVRTGKLVRENRELKHDLKTRYKFGSIVGASGKMMDVYDMTARAARVRSTVLITGETGSGKELIARAIHYNSDRAEKPFVRVNCAAVPETLLEAELFGIEKNVATGVDARMGKFEAANGGTIFLDEIGDMAMPTQAKILRAMQEREVERVGSHTPRKVDIRIIAATNRDLARAIEEKEFRLDLFYRLNVLVIHLPPLRERKEDIPELVEHFVKRFCDENCAALKKLAPETLSALMAYPWPGNVRELENTIERSVVMCDGDTIAVEHLPAAIRHNAGATATAHVPPAADVRDLDRAVEEFERGIILSALERNDWRQNKAAADLNVTERSMWYKIKKLGIEVKKEKEGEE
ncbi:MAG: sigma-54-dependent Fis family transcriptional regulator [Nitrospinae bacterium]|nr:sigma-54-dependent Fis family transcriptional regulator [Nitrospinota bacterium]